MDKYLPGIWPARVLDYGVTDHKGGVQIEVTFGVTFTDGETSEPYEKSMKWYGYTSTDKAQGITYRALMALGFRGKGLVDLAKGPEGGSIDIGKEVTLTTIEETYQGQTRVKIQWVNSPDGGVGGIKRLEISDAAARLAKLEGSFAAFKAKVGKGTDDIDF